MRLPKHDIPQKEDLALVRRVVGEVATGATEAEAVAVATTIELRHVDYALQAARILGWVERKRGDMAVTESGRAMLSTRPASAEERAHFRRAVETTRVVRELVPYLLQRQRPNRSDIEQALMEGAGLAPTTAGRRTTTLLSWRKQLVNDPPETAGDDVGPLQLSLFTARKPSEPRAHRTRRRRPA